MSTPLEDELRAALHARAENAPTEPRLADMTLLHERSPNRGRILAIAAAVVVVAVVASAAAQDRGDSDVLANADPDSPTPAPVAPASEDAVPRLGFDLPSFRYDVVEDFGCRESTDTGSGATASTAPGAVDDGETTARGSTQLQTFAPSYFETPIIALTSISPDGVDDFGLGAPGDDEVQVRGVTGYVHEPDRDHGWWLGVKLPEGDALYVTALGIDVADVVAIVDGLERDGDGSWTAPSLPAGMRELEPSQDATRGCAYTARADGFEVDLYNDRFDSRVQDRISSTEGKVDAVDIDGTRAVFGAYGPNDHWALLEPMRGHTLEVRAQGRNRDEFLDLLAHAVFVDEATWQSIALERDEETSDTSITTTTVVWSRTNVELWHCGISALEFDGTLWEVPEGEEPFDGTNAPDSFAGEGTIERIAADELRYVDDSGVILRFVPDDDTEPPCA